MGRLAAQIFDEIIIRIDKDLRDRPQEQIINLLKEGITLVNTDKITTIIPDEKEVINFAIEHAREGSIIVHFSEKVLATLSYISQLQQKERIASTKINNSSDGQTTESAAIIEQQLQMGHS